MKAPQKRSYALRKEHAMYLSTTSRNDAAALTAEWVRENTAGYAARASRPTTFNDAGRIAGGSLSTEAD